MVMLTTPLLVADVPSPSERVAVAGSLNSELNWASKCCDLWIMKLTDSNTQTMIVSRSYTIRLHSSPLTLDGTVLKESDNLVIFGCDFRYKDGL